MSKDLLDVYDDELLFFFILLTHIWGAKYSKHNLLFFLLILLMYSWIMVHIIWMINIDMGILLPTYLSIYNLGGKSWRNQKKIILEINCMKKK